MDDEQREMLAQDIVALSAAALRDLNDGKSVPAKWAAAMQSALKPRRKSGPPGLTDRGMTLARLKRDKMLGRDGRTDEQLAELRNTDKRELHRQYRKHFVPVYVEELENRLDQVDAADHAARVARVHVINERVAAGETLEDILYDDSIDTETFVVVERMRKDRPIERPIDGELRNLDKRRANIFAWLNEGWNRHIDARPVDAVVASAAVERGLTTDAQKIAPKGGRRKRT